MNHIKRNRNSCLRRRDGRTNRRARKNRRNSCNHHWHIQSYRFSLLPLPVPCPVHGPSNNRVLCNYIEKHSSKSHQDLVVFNKV